MKKFFSFFLLLMAMRVASAASGVGNGGDLVRAVFISIGKDILSGIQQDPEKLEKLRASGVSLEALHETLDIQKIASTTGPLEDNTGAIVDAIGEPGKILLDESKWRQSIGSTRKIRTLIFHEMLRSAAVNDDGYRVSGEFGLDEVPNSIEYLGLTGEDIRSRDSRVMKMIHKINERRFDPTVGSVLNAIESEYGLQFYNHGLHKPAISRKASKRELMTAYIWDLLGIWRRGTIDKEEIENPYDALKVSRAYREHWGVWADAERDIVLQTTCDWQLIVFVSHCKPRSYETTPLHQDDRILKLLTALQQAQVGRIDASVILTSEGKNDNNLSVWYPPFSKYVQAPTPVMRVNLHSSVADMKNFLEREAPKIYAYNVLYEKNLLPSVAEIDAYLEKYPHVTRELQRMFRVHQVTLVRDYVVASFLTATWLTAVSGLTAASAAGGLAGGMAAPLSGLSAMNPTLLLSGALVVGI